MQDTIGPNRFWRKVREVGFGPVLEYAVAAWYAAIDRRTPAKVKVILAGAVGYFVLPIDVIPDIMVGMGYTDDVAVLLGALRAVAPYVMPEHRLKAREKLGRM